MPWWLIVVAAVAAVAITMLLLPKPKAPKPDATTDLENPTAEAGRPIPVPFGTLTIKGLNTLFFGDKLAKTKKVAA